MAQARIDCNNGRYSEAEKQIKQALESSKRFHSEDERLASTYTLAGQIARAQGKYAEAEQALKRALEIWKAVMGSDHVGLTYHYDELAVLYEEQGKYSAAEPLLKQALAVNEKAYDGKGMAVASAANRLAGLYATQQQYAQAVVLYERVIRITEDADGRESTQLPAPLRSCASALRKLGRNTKAGELEARADSIERNR